MCRKRSKPEMLGFIFSFIFWDFFFLRVQASTLKSLEYNQVAVGMQRRKDMTVSLQQKAD